MDTVQILCTLRNVNSFLDVYAFDLLPRLITKTCTSIVNSDPHTKGGSHWPSIHFHPKSSNAYYFDSYGIVPFVPDILIFRKRTCTTCDLNKRQLQILTSDVCGKYCCLFALYMDRSYTPHQFLAIFGAIDSVDRQVERVFTAEFGAEMPRGVWDQCGRSCLQDVGILSIPINPNLSFL